MAKGNLKSEQLLCNNNIVLDYDKPIRGRNKILNFISQFLGSKLLSHKNIDGRKVLVYDKNGENETILLTAAITYMGGNGKNHRHPTFLNRIQIPKWWNQFTNKYKEEYDIKYFGIYNYENVAVFADVQKDTYLKRDVNNSSAHIYMNDLVQAKTKGVFERKDKNGNIIITISSDNLESYLNKKIEDTKSEFSFLKKFNNYFFNGKKIVALEALEEMKKGGSAHWRETEWPGWYLEFKFQEFLEKNNFKILYKENVKDSNNFKSIFKLDFDLWLENVGHYADLKSSSNHTNEFIGNDKQSVYLAVKNNHKLWYIVYQHDTIFDRDVVKNWDVDYKKSQARERAFLINESNSNNNKIVKEDSYFGRMKNSVQYSGMFVLELNKQNISHFAGTFRQGKQPDGSSRKVKVKFNKKLIENGVIYSYNYD